MEDIFAGFEAKFADLDAKIESKNELIQRLYTIDTNKIIHKFDIEDSEFHANALNEHRQILIDKLNSIRNAQIHDINTFFGEFIEECLLFNEDFHQSKSMLYEKCDEIKNGLNYLNKKNTPEYIWDLFKFKFNQPLNINKINKYNDLLNIKKLILRLPEQFINGYIIENLNGDTSFIILPFGRIFIFVEIPNERPVLFIIKHDKLIHRKDLAREKEAIKHVFKATSCYIIHLAENMDKIDLNLKVEIYDFKLDLVHGFELNSSFKSEVSYFNNINVYKNELAFQNFQDLKILVFNYDSFKSSYINFQNDNPDDLYYLCDKTDKLIYLNEDKLFFLGYFVSIYITNRKSGVKLANIQVNFTIYKMKLVMFDYSSQMYDFDDDECLIKVYNSDGKFLYSIPLDKESLAFNANGTITFNHNLTQNSICYEEI
jgi:hypothetical protein